MLQCFDATDFEEVREGFIKAHPPAIIDKAGDPVWDRASCSYR